MKHLTLLLLAAMTLALTAAERQPAFPIYLTPKVSDAINAANMHQAKEWNSIPTSQSFGFFPFGRTGTPTAKTRFRAAYNQNGLLLQIICDEPQAATLDFSPQNALRDDTGAVFSKPVIEVFLDPSFLRNVGAHLAVNVNGAIFDRLNSNESWNYEFNKKIVPGKQGYTFYFLIPWEETNHLNPEVYIFSMTPTANPIIGFNIAREQIVGNGELSQWNPSNVQFINPKNYGALVLAGQPGIKDRMLRLFTNAVIAGGMDIQGDYTKSMPIFKDFLLDKVRAGLKLAEGLPKDQQKDYLDRYQNIKKQMKHASSQQIKSMIQTCVKLNATIEGLFFEKLQQEIFDEI